MGAAGLDELVHFGGSASVTGLHSQAALQRLQSSALATAIAARDEVYVWPAVNETHVTK